MSDECKDEGGLDDDDYDCCDGEGEDALGVHGEEGNWRRGMIMNKLICMELEVIR